jgi:AcrR family transcriptional regulator
MAYHRTERSARVREAMRARILEASRALFAAKGVEGTTIRDIVQSAGTSTGNLYFYFENKDALLQTLLEDVLGAAWAHGDELMARAPAGPRRVAVMQYATAYGLLVKDRALTRLVVGVTAHEAVERRLVEINAPRVEKALRENFPDYPADYLSLAVAAWSGGGRGIIRLAAMEDSPVDLAEAAEFAVRWNLGGLGVTAKDIDDAVAYAAGEVQM